MKSSESLQYPLVSLVIPCYNHVHFLRECLDSLATQTLNHWEAIVVDDDSPDGESISIIIESFRDQRIRIIHHTENRGLAAARNNGIRAARGQFVLPLDADDKIAPEYLGKTVTYLLEHFDCDCVFPDFFHFGTRQGAFQFQLGDTRSLLQQQWLPGSGTLLRKELWERVGGYCEAEELRAGNEDWDFYLAAAEIGFIAGHIPEPLYYYRQHKESMVTRLRYMEYRTREYMYTRHRPLFDHYGIKKEFLAEGYQRSAEAALSRGERLRTIYLAIKVAQDSTRRGIAIRLMVNALLPSYVLQMIRKGRDLYQHWY